MAATLPRPLLVQMVGRYPHQTDTNHFCTLFWFAGYLSCICLLSLFVEDSRIFLNMVSHWTLEHQWLLGQITTGLFLIDSQPLTSSVFLMSTTDQHLTLTMTNQGCQRFHDMSQLIPSTEMWRRTSAHVIFRACHVFRDAPFRVNGSFFSAGTRESWRVDTHGSSRHEESRKVSTLTCGVADISGCA